MHELFTPSLPFDAGTRQTDLNMNLLFDVTFHCELYVNFLLLSCRFIKYCIVCSWLNSGLININHMSSIKGRKRILRDTSLEVMSKL